MITSGGNSKSYTINPYNIKDNSTIKVCKKPETEIIKIRYFDPEMPRLEVKDYGDWIDCYAANDYDLDPDTFDIFGGPILIDLGFACKLPEGYEAHLAARSSSFKKWGFIVTNAVGVIDESYCGDNDHWMLAVYPTRKSHINKYDRICQFRIMKKQPYIIFDEVKKLDNPDRGGFGSTGVN